ncbi:MAG: diguanylate cyclase [Cyanobacteria bacterium P01_D01_bin.115]
MFCDDHPIHKPVILCVDDDPLILASLGEQLQRQFGADYDVELMDSSAEALVLLAVLQSEQIAVPLILSDQRMPTLPGDLFLIAAHQRLPETLTILLTGEQHLEAVKNALNHANLYRYITKPWDETDFLLTVKEALRSYQQRYQLRKQQVHLEQTNQQLAQSLATLQATLEATADGILVLNQAGDIAHFNQKLLTLLELTSTPGDSLPELAPPVEFSAAAALDLDPLIPLVQQQLQQIPALWALLQTSYPAPACQELLLKTTQGDQIFECYSQPQWLAGVFNGQVWSLRNITARKQAEAIIQHQAEHDALTGLPNRVQFDQALNQQLQSAQQSDSRFALLFVDLDNFKSVNDTLGHQVGDRLLKYVVQRLQACCRQGDLIARWGGDEFVLISPNLVQEEQGAALAQRILDTLTPPFKLEVHQMQISVSIGVAIYPQNGLTGDQLLFHADTALYQAKAQGRNGYVCFTQALLPMASS